MNQTIFLDNLKLCLLYMILCTLINASMFYRNFNTIINRMLSCIIIIRHKTTKIKLKDLKKLSFVHLIVFLNN